VIAERFGCKNPDHSAREEGCWENVGNFNGHFWDPDVGEEAGLMGATSANRIAYFYLYGGTNTTILWYRWWPLPWELETIPVSFEGAISLYRQGQKGLAYYYLGRAAHLLADMSVPAHVHLDLHPGDPFTDHYETFVAVNDPPPQWTRWVANGQEPLPAHESFSDVFLNLAQITQYVASDQVNGNVVVNDQADPSHYPEWVQPGGFPTSWQLALLVGDHTSDEVVLAIGDRLMPWLFNTQLRCTGCSGRRHIPKSSSLPTHLTYLSAQSNLRARL